MPDPDRTLQGMSSSTRDGGTTMTGYRHHAEFLLVIGGYLRIKGSRLTGLRARAIAVQALKNRLPSPQENSSLAVFKARQGLTSR
jgi:hypothetical protein